VSHQQKKTESIETRSHFGSRTFGSSILQLLGCACCVVVAQFDSMDRFIAKASASFSSAAQPEANVSSSSAAQPARQLSTISAVLRWLSTLTEQTASAMLKDIRAAAQVLDVPKPRQEDVRPLCKTWSVQMKVRQQK
jgi:hypothetical protein